MWNSRDCVSCTQHLEVTRLPKAEVRKFEWCLYNIDAYVCNLEIKWKWKHSCTFLLMVLFLRSNITDWLDENKRAKKLGSQIWENLCSLYSNKCLCLASEKFVLASRSKLSLATGLASWKVSFQPWHACHGSEDSLDDLVFLSKGSYDAKWKNGQTRPTRVI